MIKSYKLKFDELSREIMATDPNIVYTPFESNVMLQAQFKSPKKQHVAYIYMKKTYGYGNLYIIELVDPLSNEVTTRFTQTGRHQIVRRLKKLWV